ncbi:MAG: serine hydrolase [Dysosmobacter sp.]
MRRMAGLWAALLLVLALTPVQAGAVELPIQAEAALLMEKETGQVLYAQNEHEALEPASVTKVMTLLLTMEAIDAGQLHYDDVVTAQRHACSMGGSQIWLKENEQMTRRRSAEGGVRGLRPTTRAVALAEMRGRQ